MPSKTYISVPKSPFRSAQLFSCKHGSSCRLSEKAISCAAGAIRRWFLQLENWLVVRTFFAFSHQNENRSRYRRRNQRDHRYADRVPMLQDDRDHSTPIASGQEHQQGIWQEQFYPAISPGFWFCPSAPKARDAGESVPFSRLTRRE